MLMLELILPTVFGFSDRTVKTIGGREKPTQMPGSGSGFQFF
jgi:hypothetical protein